MAEAMRSMAEWADSLNMPSEPVRMPVSSLSSVTMPAAMTEKTAAERLTAWDVGGVLLAAASSMAVGLMGEMLQVWRLQRIGNRYRGDGWSWSERGLAAEVDHDAGAEEHGDTEDDESALVVAGDVLEEAHEVGADESAKDAERIDGGDGGGGGPAAEETLDDGQEGALHSKVTDTDEARGGEGDAGRVREAAGGQS